MRFHLVLISDFDQVYDFIISRYLVDYYFTLFTYSLFSPLFCLVTSYPHPF